MLVMPRKFAVPLIDLTSDLVYPAALVPHTFSSGRGDSYAWQNRMPPCTNLAHAARKDFLYAHVSHKYAYHPRRVTLAAYLFSAPTYPHLLPILTF